MRLKMLGKDSNLSWHFDFFNLEDCSLNISLSL